MLEEYINKFEIQWHGYGYSYIDKCYGRTNVVDFEVIYHWLCALRPNKITKQQIKKELQKIKKQTKELQKIKKNVQ